MVATIRVPSDLHVDTFCRDSESFSFVRRGGGDIDPSGHSTVHVVVLPAAAGISGGGASGHAAGPRSVCLTVDTGRPLSCFVGLRVRDLGPVPTGQRALDVAGTYVYDDDSGAPDSDAPPWKPVGVGGAVVVDDGNGLILWAEAPRPFRLLRVILEWGGAAEESPGERLDFDTVVDSRFESLPYRPSMDGGDGYEDDGGGSVDEPGLTQGGSAPAAAAAASGPEVRRRKRVKKGTKKKNNVDEDKGTADEKGAGFGGEVRNDRGEVAKDSATASETAGSNARDGAGAGGATAAGAGNGGARGNEKIEGKGKGKGKGKGRGKGKGKGTGGGERKGKGNEGSGKQAAQNVKKNNSLFMENLDRERVRSTLNREERKERRRLRRKTVGGTDDNANAPAGAGVSTGVDAGAAGAKRAASRVSQASSMSMSGTPERSRRRAPRTKKPSGHHDASSTRVAEAGAVIQPPPPSRPASTTDTDAAAPLLRQDPCASAHEETPVRRGSATGGSGESADGAAGAIAGSNTQAPGGEKAPPTGSRVGDLPVRAPAPTAVSRHAAARRIIAAPPLHACVEILGFTAPWPLGIHLNVVPRAMLTASTSVSGGAPHDAHRGWTPAAADEEKFWEVRIGDRFALEAVKVSSGHGASPEAGHGMRTYSVLRGLPAGGPRHALAFDAYTYEPVPASGALGERIGAGSMSAAGSGRIIPARVSRRAWRGTPPNASPCAMTASDNDYPASHIGWSFRVKPPAGAGSKVPVAGVVMEVYGLWLPSALGLGAPGGPKVVAASSHAGAALSRTVPWGMPGEGLIPGDPHTPAALPSPRIHGGDPWIPHVSDTSPWLVIDLGETGAMVSGFALQGGSAMGLSGEIDALASGTLHEHRGRGRGRAGTAVSSAIHSSSSSLSAKQSLLKARQTEQVEIAFSDSGIDSARSSGSNPSTCGPLGMMWRVHEENGVVMRFAAVGSSSAARAGGARGAAAGGAAAGGAAAGGAAAGEAAATTVAGVDVDAAFSANATGASMYPGAVVPYRLGKPVWARYMLIGQVAARGCPLRIEIYGTVGAPARGKGGPRGDAGAALAASRARAKVRAALGSIAMTRGKSVSLSATKMVTPVPPMPHPRALVAALSGSLKAASFVRGVIARIEAVSTQDLKMEADNDDVGRAEAIAIANDVEAALNAPSIAAAVLGALEKIPIVADPPDPEKVMTIKRAAQRRKERRWLRKPESAHDARNPNPAARRVSSTGRRMSSETKGNEDEGVPIGPFSNPAAAAPVAAKSISGEEVIDVQIHDVDGGGDGGDGADIRSQKPAFATAADPAGNERTPPSASSALDPARPTSSWRASLLPCGAGPSTCLTSTFCYPCALGSAERSLSSAAAASHVRGADRAPSLLASCSVSAACAPCCAASQIRADARSHYNISDPGGAQECLAVTLCTPCAISQVLHQVRASPSPSAQSPPPIRKRPPGLGPKMDSWTGK